MLIPDLEMAGQQDPLLLATVDAVERLTKRVEAMYHDLRRTMGEMDVLMKRTKPAADVFAHLRQKYASGEGPGNPSHPLCADPPTNSAPVQSAPAPVLPPLNERAADALRGLATGDPRAIERALRLPKAPVPQGPSEAAVAAAREACDPAHVMFHKATLCSTCIDAKIRAAYAVDVPRLRAATIDEFCTYLIEERRWDYQEVVDSFRAFTGSKP